METSYQPSHSVEPFQPSESEPLIQDSPGVPHLTVTPVTATTPHDRPQHPVTSGYGSTDHMSSEGTIAYTR